MGLTASANRLSFDRLRMSGLWVGNRLLKCIFDRRDVFFALALSLSKGEHAMCLGKHD